MANVIRPSAAVGPEVLSALGEIQQRRKVLQEEEAQLRAIEVNAVVAGRNQARLSWADLGAAMGMSKQAAQQRFGLLCDLAASRRPTPAPEAPRMRPGPPARGGRQQPKKRRK